MGSTTQIADGSSYAPTAKSTKVVQPGDFTFAAAFLDHGHIYGQVNGLIDAGATLKSVYDPDPKKLSQFLATYPQAKAADSYAAILQDSEIQLIAAAAIPNQRAPLGWQALNAGKDYFTDKSPFTSMEQLATTRELVHKTGQKYMAYYSERLHNDAAWQAGKLIQDGAIGKVLHVLTLAPHRLSKSTRPDWFFDKQQYGGILTDIGSHQVEQFLTYSGCSNATVISARATNFNNPDKPELEDFGEFALLGDNGASFYARVDWFTPSGQSAWGDGRTFILGTKGSIEIRKYLDVARSAPSSKLFMTTSESEQEIECLDKTGFPFFGELILDCLHRTELAMSQTHTFKAAELSMLAQQLADSN